MEHNHKDFDNWCRRTKANIQHSNQNIEEEDVRKEIIDAEYGKELKKYEREIDLPGVIPNSDKYLDREDEDGNQLWRLTVMADHVTGYLRVLKKAGFQCQEFTFDSDQYTANKNLESQLKQELSQSNEKMYSKVKINFQDLL